uniref:Glutathione S-transferase 1, isoform D n=2 Tax=Lygus hesperus TaxID=30085 RepID=A0A0A9WWR9_LYGHE
MARPVEIILFVVSAALQTLAGKPDLYFFTPSPPCRVVMMTAKVLGADLNLKMTDIMNGDQLKPEFLKINPQHTVPTFDDNGFVLSESRAIAAYLAETSPNGEKIYPKDPKKRALIEQMLYFDIGRLYQNFLDLYKPMLKGKPFDDALGKTFDESLAMFEEYLTRTQWAAGDQMSIADLSLMATVTTAEAVGHDFSKYPKIKQWMDKTKSAIPDYQMANQDGVEIWKSMFANVKKN